MVHILRESLDEYLSTEHTCVITPHNSTPTQVVLNPFCHPPGEGNDRVPTGGIQLKFRCLWNGPMILFMSHIKYTLSVDRILH